MNQKKMKQTLMYIISMIILISCKANVKASALQEYESVMINPIYQNNISQDELKKERENDNIVADVYYETIEEAGYVIRNNLVARKNSIVIGYIMKEEPSNEFFSELMDEALKHTGIAKEGDYLKYQIGGWRAEVSGFIQGTTYKLTIKYTITYYTTWAQEQEVDDFIDDFKKLCGEEEKSNYQKVSEIYDYICENIVYDYDNLENDNYLLKYTAYAAAIDKKAVCQGYAVLLYRLLMEAGIDSHIIAGQGEKGDGTSEAHAWNIVQLDHKYYYLDSTWDAGRSIYKYFLKGKNDFSDHIPMDSIYDEEIANKDYLYTENDVIQEISCVKDLQKIISNPYGSFKLTKDITLPDLNEEEMKNVCSFLDIVFEGNFDGNHHTISNVRKTLFYELSETSNVKNLKLESLNNNFLLSYYTRGEFSAGAYAPLAYRNRGVVDGCESDIKYDSSRFITEGRYVAGMCSFNRGTIRNCKVRCKMSICFEFSLTFGGISSENYSLIENCNTVGNVIIKVHSVIGGTSGGIVGLNNGNSAVVKNSTNKIELNGDCIKTGGIVGFNCNGVVEDCTNYGNVSSIKENDELYNQLVGGIIGYNMDSNIVGCKNYGRLYVELEKEKPRIIAAGGIVGQIESTYMHPIIVSECSNKGEIISHERNTAVCSNYSGGIIGVLTGESFFLPPGISPNDPNNGGVKRSPVNFFMKNCYNYGRLSSNNCNYGIPGGMVGSAHIYQRKYSGCIFENCFNYGELDGVLPAPIMRYKPENSGYLDFFGINQYYDENIFYNLLKKDDDYEINPVTFKEDCITMNVGETAELHLLSGKIEDINLIVGTENVSLDGNKIIAKKEGEQSIVAYNDRGYFDFVRINVIDDGEGVVEHSHNYIEDRMLVESICEKIMQYICLDCGKKYVKHIYCQKHLWNNGIVTKVPTTTKQGIKLYTCCNCGVSLEESIPKSSVSLPKYKMSKYKIDGLSHEIAAGKKIKLEIKNIGSNLKLPDVKWSSSNPNVATVTQNGIVTMKIGGGGKSVTIMATASGGSGISASWKIKSMKGVVRKVAVSGAKTVKAGKSLKLKAKVTTTKGANKKLKWTSSNTKYAIVTSSGKIKTFKAGKGKKVKITAMATDGSNKKKTVTIRIK